MAPLEVNKIPTAPSVPVPNPDPASNNPGVDPPPAPSAAAAASLAPSVYAAGKSAAFASSLPSVALPKSGGAIRNIDEKFQVNPNSGTCALSIPISVSQARTKAGTPSLSLSYNSGSGNGAFGLGWGISVPTITRKTDSGLPRYNPDDEEDGEDDVFVFSSAEDLVPRMKQGSASDGKLVIDEAVRDAYLVRYYRPRIEGSFFRIERCTSVAVSNDVHWRVITADNHTHIFGPDDASRISDGQGRIFSWLLSHSYDSYGNASEYSYKPEDSVNVPLLASERNRSRSANRYLKTIKYGNRFPNRDAAWTVVDTPLPTDRWMFEIVFDYGEHSALPNDTDAVSAWACRQDPFSTYRAGFEIRTYRLCRQILMLHHFPDQLGQSTVLIGSTKFEYEETPAASLLSNVSSLRYSLDDGSYASLPTPGLTFKYTQVPSVDALVVQDAATPLELAASEYQWIDLDSEGLPGVLSEQAGSWFYRRNLSANNIIDSPFGPCAAPLFGPLEQVSSRPAPSLNATTTHLADLAGTGEVDLVDARDGVRGYYTRTSQDGWSNFSPFDSWPNIDLSQPNVQYIDLTGDGIADIMVTEDNAISWFQSLGRAGYARARQAFHGTNEEKGPKLVFSDPTQSIYLADFCGDGLLDLVRIRNGDISYWPNLGYARFGEKVTMDNAPLFDGGDRFTHDRLRLADLDGSGTTDLLYLPSHGGIDIYRNHAGNAWSPAARLDAFPRVDSIAVVRTVDLLGTGCTCLVWTRPLPAGGHGMRYIDLTNGHKPLLLESYRSDLGVERKITYVPSTRFYLDARRNGTPWITRLPFPVQCVSRVEVFDHISRSYSATRYAYHHGFYDTTDREFRGFGMVEEWDTGDAVSFPGAANLEKVYLVPATRSKTWFHAGSYRMSTLHHKQPPAVTLSHQYVAEYFRGAAVLEDSLLPAGLAGTDYQQACRSLKGMILREERYVDDDSPLSLVPFHVSENNYAVSTLQPSRPGTPAKHGVFHVTAREDVTATHERDPADPQVAHTLNLSFDAYGNVLKSVSVTYGRQVSSESTLSGTARAAQQRSQVIYSENTYTNAIDSHEAHVNPLLHKTRNYHLTGLSPVGDRFSFAQFAANKFAALNVVEVPFEREDESPVPRKRLIAGSDALYRRDDLTGLLDGGVIESLALPGESYQLALTPGLLDILRGRIGVLPISALHVEGGYVDIDEHLWIPSGRHGFDLTRAKDPAGELAEARAHFFTAKRFTNPFGAATLVKHDDYDLLPIEVTDPLQNKITVSNSYVHLGPVLITDPNGNRTQVVQNPRGEVVGTAVMGKVGSAGDSLDGFRWAVPKEQESAFLTNPTGPVAATLLGNASTRTVIVDNFSPTTTAPSIRATIERENHVGCIPPKPRWALLLRFAYHDGLGREMQVKTPADNGPATPDGPSGRRWIGSGWTIWNNKGLKATEYEPFFDTTHTFQNDAKHGIRTAISFYDYRGRPVCLLSGDNSWMKVVHQTWQTTTYDASDVAEIDPLKDPDVGHFFRALGDSFSETWYSARKRDSADPLEKAAGLKTAAHRNTPGVTHLDPLGRAFVRVEQNGPGAGDFYTTRSEFDEMGNVRKVIDSQGREIVRARFDMRGQVVHRSTMDFGQEWFTSDICGKVLRRCQDDNNELRTAYDALRRPVGRYCRPNPNSSHEIQFQKLVYGEPEAGKPDADAVSQNLRGRLHQQFDQSGVVTSQYDFKGNLIRTDQQLLRDFRSDIVDWAEKPAREIEIHTMRTSFDALNRVLEHTNPDSSITRNHYNRSSLPFAVETLSPPIGSTSQSSVGVITSTEYNAMGQIIFRTHGNNTTTTNTYDPLNFRPRRILTMRATSAVQDLRYTYDARGNITHIVDNAKPVRSFQNTSVTSMKEYTYDPINRLIKSTGRENQDRLGNAIADSGAAREYKEEYSYDSTGNILSIQHSTPSSPSTSWTRRYFYEEPSPLEKQYFSNRLSRTEIGGKMERYFYDTHGNIVSMPGVSLLRWDFLNQLRKTTKQGLTLMDPPLTAYYTYDSHAQRVRKVTDWPKTVVTPSKETIYCGGYEISRDYRENGTNYGTQRKTVTVRTGTQVCRVETQYSGTSNVGPRPIHIFQLSDHLESVTIESDTSGNTLSYEEFSAYGSTTYRVLPKPLKTETAYKFSGKEKDVETGLYYFGARYYVPGLGRWVSPDPIGFGDGPNVYCYVNCNPISFRDPNGRNGIFYGVTSPEHRNWRTTVEAHLFAAGATVYPDHKGLTHAQYKYHAGQLEAIVNYAHDIKVATDPEAFNRPGYTPQCTTTNNFEGFVSRRVNGIRSLSDNELLRSMRHGWEALDGRREWDRQYTSPKDHWGQTMMTGTLTSYLIDEFLRRSPRDEAVARDWIQTRDFIRTEVNTDLNVYRATGGRNYKPLLLPAGDKHATIQSETAARAAKAAKQALFTAQNHTRKGTKPPPAKPRAR